jgi:hypothetical protein
MPSAMPKKPVKRTVKKIQTPIEPVIVAAPVVERPPHGLATATLILIFLTIGCLAAATLMSVKIKSIAGYAQNLAVELNDSRAQNTDMAGQVADLKTLQTLAKKLIAPPAVPADLVWDTYASPNLSLQYPNGYTVVKATTAFPALTIQSEKGRIEIFRMKDFPGGDRPFGFEDTNVTQAELDQYIPKEFKLAAPEPADPKISPYSVWIYYGVGDEATKAILDQAVGTIKVVK